MDERVHRFRLSLAEISSHTAVRCRRGQACDGRLGEQLDLQAIGHVGRPPLDACRQPATDFIDRVLEFPPR